MFYLTVDVDSINFTYDTKSTKESIKLVTEITVRVY